MQIWPKKDKNREPYWWWFKKSDSNDETDSDIDNNESDE